MHVLLCLAIIPLCAIVFPTAGRHGTHVPAHAPRSHFSSNKLIPTKATPYQPTTMADESPEKTSFKAKSEEAKKLLVELVQGKHGDIFEKKSISWKKVQGSDPAYGKFKYTSFANTGRGLVSEAQSLVKAKNLSSKKKDTREKVQGEHMHVQLIWSVHFILCIFYSPYVTWYMYAVSLVPSNSTRLNLHACTHKVLPFIFIRAGSETDDEEEVEDARASYCEQPGMLGLLGIF